MVKIIIDFTLSSCRHGYAIRKDLTLGLGSWALPWAPDDRSANPNDFMAPNLKPGERLPGFAMVSTP